MRDNHARLVVYRGVSDLIASSLWLFFLPMGCAFVKDLLWMSIVMWAAGVVSLWALVRGAFVDNRGWRRPVALIARLGLSIVCVVVFVLITSAIGEAARKKSRNKAE